ncbi:MAG TPA: molybdopterin cofactor-binding domain-containing protein [Roseiarcus sp.]|nr:molybdopterin cofactor-binding domain-containing protein [Roseiarcus sp.]
MTKHETIRSGAELSRRSFMVGVGAAGLVCSVGLPGAAEAAGGGYSPSVWYQIGADGLVTVNVGKADMGQHVASTMAQIVAEELGASWSHMRVNLMGNDPKYADPVLGATITGGSWSTMMNFDAMSRAGAAGRMALIEAAAPMLGAQPGDCQAFESRIAAKNGKSVSFGDIVKAGKLGKTYSAAELKAIKLKTADQYTLVGKELQQIDIPFKVNGTAKYGIDTILPGMVYGRVITPPTRYGATVKSVDDSAAKAVKGFIKAVVVEDPTKTTTGWVVVVAKTYVDAINATELVKVTYDNGPYAAVTSEALFVEAKRLQAKPDAGVYYVKEGDAPGVLSKAAKVIEAEYTTEINIHCPMEPMNATCHIKDGVVHLYSGNQFMTRSTAIAAGAAGVDPKNVVIHQAWLGGGFGRRLDSDMFVPAVVAAKATGLPVKVIYSREHDMKMDFSRPLTYQKVRAGVDENGKLVAVDHDLVSAWPTARWGIPAFLTPGVDKKGSLDGFAVHGADFYYSVPNHTIRTILNELAQGATPSGQLRSVAPGWTFWAVESMVDEVAHAIGKDPADLRLEMLDGKGDNKGALRLANTLRAAMGLAGYGTLKLPKGEGIGVACVSSQERQTSTWTSACAHVAVAADGTVTVKKLTVATDVGIAVNPDGIRAQVMGGASWGLSLAMHEIATMADGAIEQTNFDSYTPLRMADVPEIDIAIIANGDEYPRGVGEPAVTVIAPALANAIFNAVGVRVRSLPITPEKIKTGMKA